MALNDILIQIDELQAKINSYGKLDKEVLKKINYKFRLDWNYNSNAMEGNSLTKEETRTVMINNITVEGKPLKDVLEIRGHDSVITDILNIGKGELRLSEKRIKDIHKAIMHEDNPERKDKLGRWKTVDNFLTNYKGERFDFLPHTEVQKDMHSLINWLNVECSKLVNEEKEHIHAAILAFMFHLRYVTIHPFYDGNGRTARIFTNLILIAFGFPPIIIKVEDKNTYNQYLADIQAYGGKPDLFYEFMGKQLIYSQELVLKAINGESIEELSDLDKGIELLKKSLTVLPGELQKHPGVVSNLWTQSLSYLKDSFLDTYRKFKDLFENPSFQIIFQIGNKSYFADTDDVIKDIFYDEEKLRLLSSIQFICNLRNMKKRAHSTLFRIDVNLSTVSYNITNLRGLTLEKKYSEILTKEEIDNLFQVSGKSLLEELNKVTNGDS